jgi:hypothetical protein
MATTIDYSVGGPSFIDGLKTNLIDERTATTGTTLAASGFVIFGTGGPRIKNNSGVLEFRNNAETAYADIVCNNLTVQGTQTVVHSTTVTIADPIITVAKGQIAPGSNAGVEVDRSLLAGAPPNAQILWDETNDYWVMGVIGTLVRVANDPTTTQGDLLVRGASTLGRLGIGTAGQVLRVATGGTSLEYYTLPAGHTQNTDTGTTSVSFAINSTATGTLLKSDGAGNLQIRNLADAAYEDLVALTFGDGTDTMTPARTTAASWLLGHGYTGVGRNYDFTVERGTAGSDAYERWNETSDAWEFFNGTTAASSAAIHTQGTDTGTTSTSFRLDSDNVGAGVDQWLYFERGSTGADAYVQWDEANDRFVFYNGAASKYSSDIHAQNTDTGTNSAFFNINTGGVGARIKSDGAGNLQIRNLADAAYEDLSLRELTVTDGTNSAVLRNRSGANQLATGAQQFWLNDGGNGADSYLFVERGMTGADVGIRWNESLDRWEYTNDGSTWVAIASPTGPFSESWAQYYSSSYEQRLVVYGGTTAAANAWVELFLDGASATLAMVDSSAMMVEALFVGRDNTISAVSAYRYTALVARNAGVGTVTVANSLKEILWNGIGANTDVEITADTTLGNFNVRVKSHTANTCRWTASLRISEVRF